MEDEDEFVDFELGDFESGVDPEELAAFLLERLEDGPRSVSELGQDLVDAGLVQEHEFPVEQVDETLGRTDETWKTASEMVVLTRSFTETGMTFTHRLTADELADDEMMLAPDLTVLDWEADAGLELEDGGEVKVHFGDLERRASLAGPPGWLDGFEAGDLVALRRSGSQVSVTIVDEPADGSAEVEALRLAAGRWAGDGRGEEEVPFLMEAMATDPTLFRRPVPPVGELLVEAGMESRGVEWGWADEEWQTRQERFLAVEATRVMRRYRFDACCVRAMDRVQEGWAAFVADEAVAGPAVAQALVHGDVARAFADLRSDSPDRVALFGRAVAEAAQGRRGAPGLVLAGLAELGGGDGLTAEQTFTEALDLDADSEVAAGELADLVADRGDVTAALALARRDEMHEARVQWLSDEKARREGLRPKVGRNERCPCGSGRKYKVCCARDGSLRLVERMPFVVQRVTRYASSPEHTDRLFELLAAAVPEGRRGDEDQDETIRRLASDPFLVEVLTFEGGLGDRYMTERGSLMLADERSLLAAMLEEPMRLWQVEAFEEGSTMTLRDLHTDEVVEIVERRGSVGRTVGEVLMARVTWVEDEPRIFGSPIVVPSEHVAAIRDEFGDLSEATVMASWYGTMTAAVLDGADDLEVPRR